MSELKAIILADNYDEQFNQLCNVIPKVLIFNNFIIEFISFCRWYIIGTLNKLVIKKWCQLNNNII